MHVREQPSVNQAVSRGPSSRWEAPFVLWTLLSLPVVTVMVVALSVFVLGAPDSYRGARLWGGPTVGQSMISARLQAVERFYEMEVPLPGTPVDVEARTGARVLGRFHGTTDAAGFLEVLVPLVESARSDLELRVLARGQRLAWGTVALTRE